jgi:hypothetical protein
MFVARFCLIAIAAVSLCEMHHGPAVSRGFGTSRTYVVISGPITKSSPTAGAETPSPVLKKPKSKNGKAVAVIEGPVPVLEGGAFSFSGGSPNALFF